MSVHNTERDGSGRWFVVYWEGGKQRREYCGTGSKAKRLAERRDLELKLRKAQGKRQAPRHGLTFRGLAEKYLASKGNPDDTRRALAPCRAALP